MVLGPVYQPQSQYPVNPLRAAPIAAAAAPAMRYYRLWIYTCNALLFISVVGFCVVACKVLVLEPRRLLLPSLSLGQPSFLYAYAALLFQSGFLQLVGCLGAQRLNERLLNIYWFLILVLLLGDALLGVFWLFRFEKIASELKPLLKNSLLKRYGPDSHFTSLWDGIQSQYRCCGVNNYTDYSSLPSSHQYNFSGETGVTGDGSTVTLPASCCRELSAVASALRYHLSSGTTTPAPVTEALSAQPAKSSYSNEVRCTSGGVAHEDSCYVLVLAWLTQTAHVLFVLGYCVIAFIKLCFLGILRYELREMIQKIKLVQESGAVTEGDIIKSAKQNNGTILQAPQESNSIGGRGGVVEVGESPLRGNPGRRPVLLGQDAGTDSDTNSHCALILCEEGLKAPARDDPSSGANGNNNYEMGELGRRCRT